MSADWEVKWGITTLLRDVQTGEIDETTAALDNATPANMNKLVNLANSLLGKKPKYRGALSGLLEEVPGFESNKKALER